MLEILFIFGLIGLGLGMAWEYLSSLAAFPILIAGMFAVPLLSWADYLATLQRLALERLGRAEEPIPPERFYWNLRKARVLAALPLLALIAGVAWTVAIRSPADASPTAGSIIGWVSGAIAMGSTARLIAWSVIYVRASHWFNRMAPWAVGLCRNALYRLSENPEFLGLGEKRSEEKSPR